MGATEYGGLVSVRNKDSTFVAGVSATEDGGGRMCSQQRQHSCRYYGI